MDGIAALGGDFRRITVCYGFMETPRMPAALASLRKAGLRFDVMTTSFFLGRRSLKASPNSGMPVWQDKLYIMMSKQAATATDFFSIPSDRVVELGVPREHQEPLIFFRGSLGALEEEPRGVHPIFDG